MAENRAEFELNICSSSSKTTNNLLQHGHEIRVDSRLLLRVFRFLLHQSPSLSTRPTLRGVTEVRSLKLDFMVKKWRNKKILLGYLFPLYVDTKMQKSSMPYRQQSLPLETLFKELRRRIDFNDSEWF